MDNNIKWRCIYGSSSEDKHSKKNDIQSIMLRLPSPLIKKTCQSWYYMVVFCVELMLRDKKIKWRCISGGSSEDKQSIKKTNIPL